MDRRCLVSLGWRGGLRQKALAERKRRAGMLSTGLVGCATRIGGRERIGIEGSDDGGGCDGIEMVVMVGGGGHRYQQRKQLCGC